MGLAGKLGALRESQFRLFFVGQSVSVLGDGMAPLALSFAVLELTGSVSDVGYVFAARVGPTIGFLLVGGVVADRFSRRTVMLASDLVRFGSQGTVAALLIAGHAEVWHLVALQAVNGAATGFFFPALIGLTPLVVTGGRLQQANALRSLATSAGEVAGPAIAGALVATVGSGWALAADAGTFGISAIFLAAIRLPGRERLPAQAFLRDLVDGWHEFRSRTWLWAGVLAASLCSMMFTPFLVLGPAIAKQSLGGPGAWALVLSAGSAGAFLGGLAALRLRPRRPFFAAFVAYLPLALPSALLAGGQQVEAVAAGALVFGAGLILGNTLWETTLQQQVPPATLSRVTSYDMLGSMGLQPLGYALAGPISASIGVNSTLWVAAGTLVVLPAIILTLPSVRQVGAPGSAPRPE